MLKKLAID